MYSKLANNNNNTNNNNFCIQRRKVVVHEHTVGYTPKQILCKLTHRLVHLGDGLPQSSREELGDPVVHGHARVEQLLEERAEERRPLPLAAGWRLVLARALGECRVPLPASKRTLAFAP